MIKQHFKGVGLKLAICKSVFAPHLSPGLRITSHMPTSASAPLQSSCVVIVGAGITGYLTAIVLHQSGFRNITVIDSLADPTAFSRTRAYSLCIYQLGQRLLRELPELFETFKKHSLEQSTRHDVTVFETGFFKESSGFFPSPPVYWLLRTTFANILAEYIKDKCPDVEIMTSCSVLDLMFDGDSAAIKYLNSDSKWSFMQADLIIACDGSYSKMRSVVRAHQRELNSSSGFEMYRRISPSVGMCPKGLVLSAPIISAPNAKKTITADPNKIYRFRGSDKIDDLSRFDLLLLPVGAHDSKLDRIGMLCVKGDHCVWDAANAQEAYGMFEQNFPQLRIRDMFSEAEMAKFVSEKPAPFTPVERPMSLVGTFKKRGEQEALSGVVFLGDAAHSFPSDTAQGINCALEDVRIFKETIEEVGKNCASWKAVLDTYEAKRNPEIWDLMRVARTGSPYQYGQNKFGLFQYNLNKALRANLHAVAPALFQPNMDTLVRQNYNYSDVRKLADGTTRNIVVFFVSLIAVPCAAFLWSQ